jgi:phage-related protein
MRPNPAGQGTLSHKVAQRFEKAVYVLHCFQKKSPSGIRTAKTDVDLIHERLKTAQTDYEARYGKKD